MLKAASLTVRVKPETRDRLDNLARTTRRSKSYVIKERLTSQVVGYMYFTFS